MKYVNLQIDTLRKFYDPPNGQLPSSTVQMLSSLARSEPLDQITDKLGMSESDVFERIQILENSAVPIYPPAARAYPAFKKWQQETGGQLPLSGAERDRVMAPVIQADLQRILDRQFQQSQAGASSAGPSAGPRPAPPTAHATAIPDFRLIQDAHAGGSAANPSAAARSAARRSQLSLSRTSSGSPRSQKSDGDDYRMLQLAVLVSLEPKISGEYSERAYEQVLDMFAKGVKDAEIVSRMAKMYRVKIEERRLRQWREFLTDAGCPPR